MDLPDMMKHGSYAETFYVEYMRRTTPYNMPDKHFHPYYEIYFLLSGKRVYFVKDTTYPVEAGDIVLIEKNEVHKTLLAGEPEHERIVIHFDDRFVKDVLKQHAPLLLSPFQSQSPVIRLQENNKEQLTLLMTRILTELHTKSVGYDILLSQAITELLLVCSRHIASNKLPEPEYVSPMHRKISDVVRFLNTNYSEPIRIDDLAARFFISSYYLSRVFKQVTGFTLIDYLNLTRVKEAQRLLRETSLSITAIAAQAGYDNFSHFGKMFKKITRTSARDYRKENHVNN